MRANLHTATSHADQHVSIKIPAIPVLPVYIRSAVPCSLLIANLDDFFASTLCMSSLIVQNRLLQVALQHACLSAGLLHPACIHPHHVGGCPPSRSLLTQHHSTTDSPAEPVQGARGQETQENAQAHAEQVQQLQAAHTEELRSLQQAAQQAEADMQAAHAAESSIIKEAHAADLKRLRALQDALPEQLMQLQSAEHRPSSDLSPSEIGACQPSLV